MSSIIRQKVGDKIYLYESISYRNQQGQPRNRRVPIGKIDTATGNPIYKPEYLARMATADKLIEIPASNLEFSAEDIRRSSVKEFGAFYLFKNIAENVGLLHLLKLPRLHTGARFFFLLVTLFQRVIRFCIAKNGSTARIPFPFAACHHSESVSY